MEYHFSNKKITGVLSVLPENEYRFEDEVANPDDPKARRLKKIIGFGTRRRVKGDTTMSDLFLFGLKKLIAEGKLNTADIGAVVVVTLCPDYFLPQISTIIHGELGLSRDVQCIDIPQACAGYVVGLIESFMLLEHMKDKKVILCSGEILCRKSGEEPRVEEPSFGGDIGNITVIENCESGYNPDIYARSYYDGSARENLVIRYGGFRNPMTPEVIASKHSNTPCTRVDMDGSGVFNFVQKEVPPMIKEIAEVSGHSLDEFDHFLFHQPNKFMLQKLAAALEVPFDKVPMDITEKLGNSDSGTIPAVMTSDVNEYLIQKDNLCCLSGFGGGLTWAAIVMNVGHLDFCENVVSNL